MASCVRGIVELTIKNIYGRSQSLDPTLMKNKSLVDALSIPNIYTYHW